MPCLPMVAARLRAVDGDLPRPKVWKLSTARMRARRAHCVHAAAAGSARKRAVGQGRVDPQQGQRPQACFDGAGEALLRGECTRLLSSVSPAVLSSWFSWQLPLWCKPGDSCRQGRGLVRSRATEQHGCVWAASVRGEAARKGHLRLQRDVFGEKVVPCRAVLAVPRAARHSCAKRPAFPVPRRQHHAKTGVGCCSTRPLCQA